MLWPVFTICRFSQSKPSQRYCEFWVQDIANWCSQWIRRCSKSLSSSLPWKACLCSATVEQFPCRETSATWLLMDVESSCQMAPGGHWTFHLEADQRVQEKIELIEVPSEQQRKMDMFDIETTVDSTWIKYTSYGYKDVLSCSASLSLQLYCTRSGLLFASSHWTPHLEVVEANI